MSLVQRKCSNRNSNVEEKFLKDNYFTLNINLGLNKLLYYLKSDKIFN